MGGVAGVLLFFYYKHKQEQAAYTPRRRTRSIKCKFPENVNLRELEIVVVTEENENIPAIERYPTIAMKDSATLSLESIHQQPPETSYTRTKRRRSQKCVFPDWVNLRDLEIVLVKEDEGSKNEQEDKEKAEESAVDLKVENNDLECTEIKDMRNLYSDRVRETEELDSNHEGAKDKLLVNDRDLRREAPTPVPHMSDDSSGSHQLLAEPTHGQVMFTDEEFDQILSAQTPTDAGEITITHKY